MKSIWPIISATFQVSLQCLKNTYQNIVTIINKSIQQLEQVESIVNNIPTIAFDNGEASEAIVNKVNGFLIPKFDKKKFAEAIFDTIFDKNLNNDKEWSNFLKLRYSSKTEAEMIINKALSDFKK